MARQHISILRFLTRKKQREKQLDRELPYHIERQPKENIRRGRLVETVLQDMHLCLADAAEKFRVLEHHQMDFLLIGREVQTAVVSANFFG